MKDENISIIFIGYKDSHPNHHWRMKSSSNPIDSWKEKKPLIKRRDFHKLSLRENRLKEGFYGWFLQSMIFYLCWKRTYNLEMNFGKRKMLDWGGENVTHRTSFFFLEINLWIFCFKFKILTVIMDSFRNQDGVRLIFKESSHKISTSLIFLLEKYNCWK